MESPASTTRVIADHQRLFNQTFSFANDTSARCALGLNTFFSGNDATNIAVNRG